MDIIHRLNALARSEHDDLSIGFEASATIIDLRLENKEQAQEIERLRMIVGCECIECQDDEERVAVEYAALKMDAERYRWLRENGYQMIGEDRGNGGLGDDAAYELERRGYELRHTHRVGFWVDGRCGYMVSGYFDTAQRACETAWERVQEAEASGAEPAWKFSTHNAPHEGRPAALSPGVRVDGPVGPQLGD